MRRLFRSALALNCVLLVSACTPEEITSYLEFTRPAREGAEANGLDSERLGELIHCESGWNPQAVGGGGRYRGLGQFNQSTWDGVAERWYPALVGVDPTTVEEHWQIAMIWALWAERGSQPWPVCGR